MTIKWISGLENCTQKVFINGFSEKSIAPFLDPVLFNTLIHESDEKLQKIFLHFEYDIKIGWYI